MGMPIMGVKCDCKRGTEVNMLSESDKERKIGIFLVDTAGGKWEPISHTSLPLPINCKDSTK